MATIGSLNVELRTNIAKFAQGMNQANKRLDSFARDANKLKGVLGGLFVAFSLDKIIDATKTQEMAMRQLEQAVKSTGGVAGFTAKELANMAAGFQSVTNYGDEAIISMQAILLTFTSLKDDIIPRTTEAVLNLSERMGTDLNSAALQLGKALNAPVANLGALSRAGIQFSNSQKDNIKLLVESGRLAEAQGIILDELETQFGGAARAARETFGGALESLNNAFGDLLESNDLEGARLSIEQLIKVLQDPNTVQAFSKLTSAAISLSQIAINLGIEITDLGDRIGFFAASVSGNVTELDKLKSELKDVEKALQGGIFSTPIKYLTTSREELIKLRGEYSNLVDELEGNVNPIQDIRDNIIDLLMKYGTLSEALSKVESSQPFEGQAKSAEFLQSKVTELQNQINELVDNFVSVSDIGKELNTNKIEPIPIKSLETAEEYGKKMYELARQAFPEATQSAEEWAQAQADATQRFLELNDELYANESAAKKWLEDYKLLAQFLSGDELAGAVEQLNERFTKSAEENSLKWSDAWKGTFERFTAGVGDAVASAVLEQKTFSDAMRDITRSIIHQVIAGLVDIGAQKVVLALLSKKLQTTDTVASVANAGVVASAWAPAAAAVSAATFGASAVAGTAALSTTYATSNAFALAGVAHDGLSSVPTDGTYLLQKGEKVVSNEDSKKLDMLLDQGMTQPTRVTVNIQAMDAAGVARVLSSPSAKKQIESFALRTVQDQYLRRGSRGGPLS